jgi:hypothetical protein
LLGLGRMMAHRSCARSKEWRPLGAPFLVTPIDRPLTRLASRGTLSLKGRGEIAAHFARRRNHRVRGSIVVFTHRFTSHRVCLAPCSSL